ncbi:MAG: type II toxin-antitoxin system Phd/YefM family antitoxin [Chloroflexi bacterium]|nr:type II toxin-antitoxin system Phd/YefM family antitoxin [Chloroflexota bacterium]
MARTLPIIEARNQLTSLPEQFEREPAPEAVTVTRRGKPVLAILPWDLYESVLETLEILGDETLMTMLRQSIREANEGHMIPWDVVKAELHS